MLFRSRGPAQPRLKDTQALISKANNAGIKFHGMAYLNRFFRAADYAAVQQVAQATGVSTSTVSRVLNNADFAKEQTRRRILDAAKNLGYVRAAERRSSRLAVSGCNTARSACNRSASRR